MEGNLVQSLGAEELASLPPLFTYEGRDPELSHLLGLLMPTARAEELVYVGERENIWVESYDGKRWQPWKNVWITEYDAQGRVILPKHEPIPERGPDAMSTGDLAGLGMTDAALAELAMKYLQEEWAPDRPGPSDLRRALFDRVMAKVYEP
jgi:hypothetical protein